MYLYIYEVGTGLVPVQSDVAAEPCSAGDRTAVKAVAT